ncbi:hypothetical protein JTB14_001283 [Gonioctena quinquepunctata]|nr:hypothetical protein JTB14_001283 [Gonioctena quinquepunctata]
MTENHHRIIKIKNLSIKFAEKEELEIFTVNVRNKNVNCKLMIFYEELSSSDNKAKYLPSKLNRLTKKPRHITVLLGPEETNPKDLAKLILWCIGTQIPFISFYDYKGNLKKREEDLQYEVSLYKQRDEDHIVWHSDPKILHKNGFAGRKTHVKILSEYDGKHSVVELTKRLASSISDVSISTINENLSKQFEFPDPDMGIVCGKVLQLFNYPPWQIRLTEFFRIDTIQGITLPVFLELLFKFSKCEQRLGK